MQSKNDKSSDLQTPTRSLSLASVIQFLGASSIIAIATWGLNNIISAKGNQQQQLNTFINTISDFMIQNNLDGQSSGKPDVPAVTRAARGYALNTLNTLDGVLFIEDRPKKLALLKFLYDSELIGFCKDSTAGRSKFGVSSKCYNTRIKLKDARLVGLRFASLGSILAGINLSGSNLSNSDFSGIDLSHSKFKRALLRSSDFNNTILQSTDFSSAFLVRTNLAGADITNANFNNAQLCGADFTDVIGFQTAKLNQVTFDAKTKLPENGKSLLISNNGIYVGPKEETKDCQVTRTLD